MKEIQNVLHVLMELIQALMVHIYVISAQMENIHLKIKQDVIIVQQVHIQMKEIQNVLHVQKEHIQEIEVHLIAIVVKEDILMKIELDVLYVHPDIILTKKI